MGEIVPFRERLSVDQAQTLIWQRETGRSTGAYSAEKGANHPDKVFVDPYEALHAEFDIVLAVRIAPNIEPLTGDELASRAIISARSEFGHDRKDGISYLLGATNVGIETPLRPDYEYAILRTLGVTSLEDALEVAVDTRQV